MFNLQNVIILNGSPISGRQHVAKINFCHCEDEAVVLTRQRIWPSSPKRPQIGYSFHFMELMRSLMLESHVSIKGFLNAYSNMHLIQNDNEVNINHSSINVFPFDYE